MSTLAMMTHPVGRLETIYEMSTLETMVEAPPDVTNAGPPAPTNAGPPQTNRSCMPGVSGTRFLRCVQFFSAVTALRVMLSTRDFVDVGYTYLVAVLMLQIVWSLWMAVVQRFPPVSDGIMMILLFTATWASAGMTVLIRNDMYSCWLNQNNCTLWGTAAMLSFVSWLAGSPIFVSSLLG